MTMIEAWSKRHTRRSMDIFIYCCNMTRSYLRTYLAVPRAPKKKGGEAREKCGSSLVERLAIWWSIEGHQQDVHVGVRNKVHHPICSAGVHLVHLVHLSGVFLTPLVGQRLVGPVIYKPLPWTCPCGECRTRWWNLTTHGYGKIRRSFFVQHAYKHFAEERTRVSCKLIS